MNLLCVCVLYYQYEILYHKNLIDQKCFNECILCTVLHKMQKK